MIKLKSPAEIKLMMKSGEILAEVKQAVSDAIVPGITTAELDKVAHDLMKKRNVKPAFLDYGGFPAVACISVNEQLIHGIPGKKILKEGDVVSVDMGVIYKGYYSDSAFTKGVGTISKSDKKLIQVARDAFYVGLDAMKIGARIGDIEEAIGNFVKAKGYYVPDGFTGHGIGTSLHEDPQVHNKGFGGTGPIIKEGLVIAIEPMILKNSDNVIHLNDGWTIISKDKTNTAHYEHTIAMIDGVATILTGDM